MLQIAEVRNSIATARISQVRRIAHPPQVSFVGRSIEFTNVSERLQNGFDRTCAAISNSASDETSM
jgi:hypothetical protein